MTVSRLLPPMKWPFSKSRRPSVDLAVPRRGLDEPAIAGNLVRALPDAALLIDAAGVVLLANAQARAAFDRDPEGHHISATLRAPAVLDAVAAALRGEAPRPVELELPVPLPRSFDVFVASIGKSDEPGPAAVMIFKDLTREQRIERIRADFVANASHELRTPLASISGFIETMQGAAKNDETAREKFLALMRTQAERMRRLIDDLLSLSRIEINEHVRPTATVDLAQVARMVLDALMPMARGLGCEIRLEDVAPLLVTGDRDELTQVVQNLVENALKYAGSGKLVEIGGSRTDGHVELSIRDHGPGIAEEHIPRLTERFYRVNVQDSRSRGGTGLGLAIVKHILNRHRGRLAITSEIDRGSVFTIRFPLPKS